MLLSTLTAIWLIGSAHAAAPTQPVALDNIYYVQLEGLT
jgi:hypothetical protein